MSQVDGDLFDLIRQLRTELEWAAKTGIVPVRPVMPLSQTSSPPVRIEAKSTPPQRAQPQRPQQDRTQQQRDRGPQDREAPPPNRAQEPDREPPQDRWAQEPPPQDRGAPYQRAQGSDRGPGSPQDRGLQQGDRAQAQRGQQGDRGSDFDRGAQRHGGGGSELDRGAQTQQGDRAQAQGGQQGDRGAHAPQGDRGAPTQGARGSELDRGAPAQRSSGGPPQFERSAPFSRPQASQRPGAPVATSDPDAAARREATVARLRVLGDRPSLDQIREVIGDCTRCKLHTLGRTQIVFGVGNPQAEIMFVGEGPGADEDRLGEPFVGKAGQLLTRIIEGGMGIARSDVYIANVLKCRPPNNRDPEADEVEQCEPFLRTQIATIGPKVIITLGRHAAHALLKISTPITRLRGKWTQYGDVPVMPTYHPAYLLRNPEEKRAVWEDIQEVLKRLGKPIPGRASGSPS